MEHSKLTVSLNNAIAYSYVLGWYAGRDGAPTDSGKISATEKIKKMHPDIVLACNTHASLTQQRDDLLAACELSLGAIAAAFLPQGAQIGDKVALPAPYAHLYDQLEAAIAAAR